MNIHDDVSVEWAVIDGEGLVRVFPVADFRSGFALTAAAGKAAEELGHYPEVTLGSHKVTVTIPQDGEGRDHQLAHAIDTALGNATK